jgi:hypothetical protein
LHGKEAAWEAFRDGGEFLAGLEEVDGIHFGGVVVEAAFCYAETDAAVCAGDFGGLVCMGLEQLGQEGTHWL